MSLKRTLEVFLIVTIALGIQIPGALANDFHDPERLVRILTADDVRDLARAEVELEASRLALREANAAVAEAARLEQRALTAEQELQDAIDAGAEQEKIDRLTRVANAAREAADSAAENAPSDEEVLKLEQDVETAKGEVEGIETEIEKTAELVGELSPDQVFAFNRSLNNAVHSGLVVDIDSPELQEALDEEYGKLRINALTRAFEQEAKFEQLAAKFDDEHKAERFLERADTHKQRFLDKIEHFAAVEARQAAKRVARDEAREAAEHAARETMKQEMRGQARAAARHAARQAAHDATKAEHREGRGKGPTR
jgi:hypothetical protein